MFAFRPSWPRVGSVLASAMLACIPLVPATARAVEATPERNETVHVQTDPTGSIRDVTIEEQIAGEDETVETQTDQQPPIIITTTYTLDGEEVEPTELAGASGHLIIRLDYENTVSSLRTISGTERRIFTPFVCLTTTVLDSEVFSNVEVTNGRVIEDKGGIAVIGLAAPGLAESLDLDPDEIDLDIPEHVEIAADVNDLELDPIYTIVTPELLNDLDTSALDVGDIEGTDKLREAMDQLVAGSGTLSETLEALSGGSAQLSGGIGELRRRLGLLPAGTSAMSRGARQLEKGLTTASEVADQLAKSAEALPKLAQSAGAELGDVGEAVGAAGGKVETAAQSIAALKAAVGALDLAGAQDATDTAHAAASGARDAIAEAQELLAASSATVSGTDAVAGHLTDARGALDSAAAELAGIDLSALKDIEGISDEQLALIESAQATIDGAEGSVGSASGSMDAAQSSLGDVGASVDVDLSGPLAALDERAQQLGQSADVLEKTSGNLDTVVSSSDDALAALGEAGSSLAGTSGSLTSAGTAITKLGQTAGALSYGLSGLSTQLPEAVKGARGLAEALEELDATAPQIVQGVGALGEGADQLTGALAATAEGSRQLTDGLSTFNDEGISTLVDELNGLSDDIDDLRDRMDALRDAAKEYDRFGSESGDDGQTSSVRFIYKTERIG